MDAVNGVNEAHHVIRHKVAQPDPASDEYAAIAAAQSLSAGNTSSQDDSSNQSSDVSQNVNEAFSKMNVAMQNFSSQSDSGSDAAINPAKGSGKKTATEQFMDFMHLSPREKIQAGMLAELGITPEEYAAMSPEEKAKVDNKIEEMIRKKAETAVAVAPASQMKMAEGASAVNSVVSALAKADDPTKQQDETSAPL